ncbi:MAG: hypothetical protein D3904_16110, partial [Candidatus Electrothrix sp. EH2]|nr:hypothetical protein [Candidatus Electrothrix sp. EH2]
RDLLPDNRNLTLYRGPRRSIYNWQRYCAFCQRLERQQDKGFKGSVARALVDFLRQEAADAAEGSCASSVNCTSEELLLFAEELGVSGSNPEFIRWL